jgi:hypothetical protein
MQTGPTTGGPGIGPPQMESVAGGQTNHMAQSDSMPQKAPQQPNTVGISLFGGSTPTPNIGMGGGVMGDSPRGMGGTGAGLPMATGFGGGFMTPQLAPQQQAPQPYTYQPYQNYYRPQQSYQNYSQPQQGGINQPFSQQYNPNQQQLMNNIQALLSQLFGQNR